MVKKKLFSEIPRIEGGRLVLKAVTQADRPALQELADSPAVYRYLPTFLFERKYADPGYVIERLYDECLQDSIILGVYRDQEFCGLAEMYGYREPIHKISVGSRLLERFWGQGIASVAIGVMLDYLLGETEIEIVTASTMVENRASAKVLRKNGFQLVVHAADEDWGYDRPTLVDKWIR